MTTMAFAWQAKPRPKRKVVSLLPFSTARRYVGPHAHGIHTAFLLLLLLLLLLLMNMLIDLNGQSPRAYYLAYKYFGGFDRYNFSKQCLKLAQTIYICSVFILCYCYIFGWLVVLGLTAL